MPRSSGSGNPELCASTTDPQAQRGEALSTVFTVLSQGPGQSKNASAGTNEVPFHRWKTEALRSCGSQVSPGRRWESGPVRSGAVTFISVCSLAGPGGPQAESLSSQMPHSRGKPQAFLYQRRSFQEHPALLTNLVPASPGLSWTGSCLGFGATPALPLGAGVISSCSQPVSGGLGA